MESYFPSIYCFLHVDKLRFQRLHLFSGLNFLSVLSLLFTVMIRVNWLHFFKPFFSILCFLDDRCFLSINFFFVCPMFSFNFLLSYSSHVSFPFSTLFMDNVFFQLSFFLLEPCFHFCFVHEALSHFHWLLSCWSHFYFKFSFYFLLEQYFLTMLCFFYGAMFS